MKNRFWIQPAWLDFSMFWAAILISLSVAIILQMELVGYGPVNWLAASLLVATLAVAGLQLGRSRLVLSPTAITVQRLLPGNTLHLTPAGITAVQYGRHTVTLTTRDFGAVTLVHFGQMAALKQSLQQLV